MKFRKIMLVIGLLFVGLVGIGLKTNASIVNKSFESEAKTSEDEKLRAAVNGFLFDSDVDAVSAGYFHTIVLTKKGSVYTFGRGGGGQLGNGESVNKNTPVKIDSAHFNNETPIQIAGGENHTSVLTKEGTVYTFGYNPTGVLGHGDEVTKNVPTAINANAFNNEKPVMIGAGTTHNIVLTDKGSIYTFGSNRYGQLGHNNQNGVNTPTKIATNFDGETPTFVDAGSNHSIVITKEGSIYTFGENEYGELGHGTSGDNYLVPTKITSTDFGGETPVDANFEDMHIVILTKEGGVFTSGYGGFGQLGHGNRETLDVPTKITATDFGGEQVVHVCGGDRHTLVLTDQGSMYSFGSNTDGQLGLGDTDIRDIPTKITGISLDGEVPRKVCGGNKHTMMITEQGSLYTFGDNSMGQLGFGNNVDLNIPTKLSKEPATVIYKVNNTPTIAIVGETSYFADDVTIGFSDTSVVKSAMLDGVEISNGHIIDSNIEKLYTLVLTDTALNEYEYYIDVDGIAPVITGITDGEYYNTPMPVTITDKNLSKVEYQFNDGDWTKVSAPYVLPKIDGKYSIRAIDHFGNTTSMTVYVDSDAPDIGGVVNGNKYNNQVELIVTADDLEKVEYQFNDDGNWVEMSSPYEIPLVDGKYDIRASDIRGNVSDTITIYIDTTPPIIGGVIDGNYYNEQVILEFTDPDFDFAEYRYNDGDWEILPSPYHLPMDDGKYELRATGELDNVSDIVTVYMDTTAPVINGIEDGVTYNEQVILTISDSDLDRVKVRYNDGSWVRFNSPYELPMIDGKFEIKAFDVLGNESDIITIYIDVTPPVISGIEDMFVYNGTITLDVYDNDLAKVEYSFEDGTWVVLNAPYKVPNIDGKYSLRAIDVAGNVSEVITIFMDNTAPTIGGIEDSKYYNQKIYLTFTDEDFAKAEYRYNDGSWTELYSPYKLPFKDGKFEVRAYDEVGNVSAIVTVYVDSTPPVISGADNEGHYNKEVILTVTGDDVAKVEYSFDNGSFTVLTAPYKLPTVDGKYTVRAIDNLGNTSEELIVYIDTTAPVLKLNGEVVESGKTYYFNGKVVFSYFDKGGVDFEDATGEIINQKEGEYTLGFTDEAGNKSEVTVVIDFSYSDNDGISDWIIILLILELLFLLFLIACYVVYRRRSMIVIK